MIAFNILVIFQALDVITTHVGITYYGSIEANPFMAPIVTNLKLFIALKILALLLIWKILKTLEKEEIEAKKQGLFKHAGTKLNTYTLVFLNLMYFAVILNNIYWMVA